MELENLRVYIESMDLGESIYNHVTGWNNFNKFSIGNQIVRSADSIATNISEGYGRYHYKEKKHFAYYSRGSLFETKTWITKARNRKLITESVYTELTEKITLIGKMLNKYIASIGS